MWTNKMLSLKKIIKHRTIQLLLIVFVTYLAYSNILDNEFVWDDNYFIVSWEQIRDFGNAPDLLKGELPPGQGGVYRPIRSVSYATSYHLFGTNPLGYHLQSITIHLLCTILIYLIILKMTQKSILALMTSLLFGVHPIHTEAITFITTSFDIIGVVFFFAAFYFYLISRQKSNGNSKAYLSGAYFLSILCAAIAFFTYELTLTLPFLLILYELIRHKRFSWVIRKGHLKCIPYFAFAGIYLFIRFFVTDTPARSGYFADSFYLTALTMVKVIIKYLLISIIPLNLTVNHIIPGNILTTKVSENVVGVFLAQSLSDPPIIIATLLLLTLFFTALRLFRTRPLISFSIGWFFICLLPVSNLFFPFGTIMAEKYLYISSFAACFMISFLLYKLYCFRSYRFRFSRYIKIAVILLFASLFLFYSFQTHQRNNDWQDSFSLWSKTAQQTPESLTAAHNLGEAYLQLGKPEQGIPHLHKAIRLNPQYTKPYISLASSYIDTHQLKKAEEVLEKTIEMDPDSDIAYIHMGYVYELRKEYNHSITFYRKAIELDDTNAYYHLNLAFVYHLQGRSSLAAISVKKAISLDQNFESMLIQSARKHKKHGNYVKAKAFYARASVGRKYR